MENLIYLKTIIFFAILFFCGVAIIRRLTEEKRAQILLPAGAILGVAFYIFLINLVAHILKGPPGFYISLLIESAIAFLLTSSFKVPPIEFPKGELLKLSLISLFAWLIFLYILESTSQFAGDVINHYIHAALFMRGDYPLHSAYQPEYLSSYHQGAAQFLGAMRSITGGPYIFMHRVLGILMILAWSQILTWIWSKDMKQKFTSFLIFSIPAVITIISLGGFMIAWPTSFSIHLSGSIFQWLGQLPTLEQYSQDGGTGSPGNLDMMIDVLHRLLSFSFFICLLIVLAMPKKNSLLLLATGIIMLIASIALVDEAVLIAILPAVFVISFFTIFNKSIFKIFLFSLISVLIIIFQGGLITNTVFDPNSKSEILLFPQDGAGKQQKYQTFRFSQESSRLMENLPQYEPFRWFHPGIYLQLSALLLICISISIPQRLKFALPLHNFNQEQEKRIFQSIEWLLLLSSLGSLIAFHGIVTKYYPFNGSRFLTISYFLSGLGITFYLVQLWWHLEKKKWLILRLFIIWVLLFSFIPPLFHTFPRPSKSQLLILEDPLSPSFLWVQRNLPIKERLIVLNQPNPTIITNMGLVMYVGALTPMWNLQPKVSENFDMSPLYADAYFTLDPAILRELKISYLIIGKNYLPQLTQKRKQDLDNKDYFQVVFQSPNKEETIYKITSKYLAEANNIGGTLTELAQIAPKSGTYYIDSVPLIPERMFAALILSLADRDLYYTKGAWYDARFNANLKVNPYLLGRYDFLLLSDKTPPEAICSCQAKLMWSGTGNGIKLWKTD